MKKTILNFNESAFNRLANEIKAGVPFMNTLLKLASDVDLVKIKSSEDLCKLASEGQQFLKSKIAEDIEPTFLGKFKLKKSVQVDMLDLPSLDHIDEAANAAREYAGHPEYYLVKNGQVEINNDEFEKLKDRFCLFAKDSAEVEMKEAFEEAAKSLDKLQKILKGLYGNEIIRRDNTMDNFFLFKEGEIRVNTNWYGQYPRTN